MKLSGDGNERCFENGKPPDVTGGNGISRMSTDIGNCLKEWHFLAICGLSQ